METAEWIAAVAGLLLPLIAAGWVGYLVGMSFRCDDGKPHRWAKWDYRGHSERREIG